MRKTNTHVYINYIGSLVDGDVFDDRKSGEPLRVLLGSQAVPRGLEKELFEMEAGEERTVVIEPAMGYGEHLDEAVFKMPFNTVPNPEALPVGGYVLLRNKNAKEPARAKVVSVQDFHVTFDLNHPLAGQTLKYWVKVVGDDDNPPAAS